MAKSTVSVKVITWEGAATMERAADLKAELLGAFDTSSQVVLSMSMLDLLDVAAVQIILAAKAEAIARAKVFRLTGTIKEGVAKALVSLGLLTEAVDSAADLDRELFGSVAAKGRA